MGIAAASDARPELAPHIATLDLPELRATGAARRERRPVRERAWFGACRARLA